MDAITSLRKPEILIIDDSPEQIYLVEAILREENYLVRALTAGKKVIKCLERGLPELILLDVVMPETDGLTICRELKNDPRYSTIPIIFLTSMNDTDSIVNGFAAGAEDYVAKPVNPKELLARVATHIHLKRRTDKLIEAYHEIEEFSHMVSHDLKAPLGLLEKLAKHAGEAEHQERNDILEMISEKANEAAILVDKLGEISKMLSMKFTEECIDMNQLACEVRDKLLQDIKEREIEFTIEELPCISGDRALIRQVLVNLFANALKFTQGKDKAMIHVKCQKVCRKYKFTVKDNGAGFDMKYAGRLYQMFERLHSQEEFQGTGLGLTIVKKIITRHGGEISIVGEVNKGAEVSFTLPT